MTSALIFCFLWILSLFLGYKFVLLNVNELEKRSKK